MPRPIRRADLAAFRAVAQAPVVDVGRILPRLSKAANRSVLWFGIAGVLASVGGRFGRRAALRGVLSIVVTSTVTNLPAKLLAGRGRPDLSIVPEIRQLARVPTSTSFPSGHSASAFAFATAVSLEYPRVRRPLYGLAAVVAASRVTTGVHYPGDVLVGAAIGAGVGLASRGPWPLADRRPASAPTDGTAVVADSDGEGLVVVANTDAGNVLAQRPRRQLLRELPRARLLAVEESERLHDALRRASRDARVIGVAGGDGSAATAAAVAAEARLPLLIVAAGTLNHFATDLGIELVGDSVRAVRQRRAVRMDLGEVGDRVFVNTMVVGAYPAVVRQRERLEDRLGKWVAAAIATARVMIGEQPVEVEVDGRHRRVWQLFVGNGRFEGEGIAPTRRRDLADGVLDVRLVSAEVPWSRARVLASILTGRRGRCKAYERWSATELDLAFSSQEGRGVEEGKVACDGEAVRVPPRVTVRKRSAALTVLQPEPSGGD